MDWTSVLGVGISRAVAKAKESDQEHDTTSIFPYSEIGYRRDSGRRCTSDSECLPELPERRACLHGPLPKTRLASQHPVIVPTNLIRGLGFEQSTDSFQP